MVAFRARAEKTLAAVTVAVWYLDTGCHSDSYTISAYVATYGQVDAAVERMGALLRDDNLGDDAEIVVHDDDPDGRRMVEKEMRMPLARRPFFPYEVAVSAGGQRDDDAWRGVAALHLGAISGREAEPPAKAGWFWGVGFDGRVAQRAGDARWSAGPGVRLGWAFGALAPDRPASGANRGTYVYGQLGAEWSTNGPAVVTSVGLTTLALAEYTLTRYNGPATTPSSCCFRSRSSTMSRSSGSATPARVLRGSGCSSDSASDARAPSESAIGEPAGVP